MILLFVSVITLGIWYQFSVIFNPDNFWLLFITNKLLHGGKYYKDFFEVNPPLILYLYTLPVIIANFFHVSVYALFRFYVAAIVVTSIITCSWLFRLSDGTDHKIIRYSLIASLIYIFFFFFPVISGEREYLALAFILPYLLLVNLRVQGRRFGVVSAILIGLFAGIGYAIKPYFLIPLCFVEIYLIVRKKSFFALFRPEAFTIVIVLILYLVSIFIVTPEYINKIIPLAASWYYMGYHFSWKFLYGNLPYLFMIIVPVCFLLLRKRFHYKTFADIVFLSMVGFSVAYYVARQAWIYHFFPAYALLVILMVVCIAELFYETLHTQKISSKQLYINVGFIIFMLAVLLLSPVANSQKTTLSDYRSTQYSNFIKIHSQFDRNIQDRSMAVFSTTLIDMMILTKYGRLYSTIRYPNPLYLLMNYYKSHKLLSKVNRTKYNEGQKPMINLFVEDLEKHPPTFIFFEVAFGKKKLSYPIRALIYPGIVKTLSINKKFKKLWQNYQFVKRIKIFSAKDNDQWLVMFKRVRQN